MDPKRGLDVRWQRNQEWPSLYGWTNLNLWLVHREEDRMMMLRAWRLLWRVEAATRSGEPSWPDKSWEIGEVEGLKGCICLCF